MRWDGPGSPPGASCKRWHDPVGEPMVTRDLLALPLSSRTITGQVGLNAVPWGTCSELRLLVQPIAQNPLTLSPGYAFMERILTA